MASQQRRTASRTRGTRNDAQTFIDSIAGLTESLAESRKHRLSMRLKDAAMAAHDFGKTLDDLPHLREYVEEASAAIEELGNYVEQAGIREMFDEARNYARQRPLITLGAGLAAGIAASQLLASAPRSRSGRHSRNGSRYA